MSKGRVAGISVTYYSSLPYIEKTLKGYVIECWVKEVFDYCDDGYLVWKKAKNKYHVTFKKKSLGYYRTAEEAAARYNIEYERNFNNG